ncbi:MAG: ROK family protein [Planctomycetota bacterium]
MPFILGLDIGGTKTAVVCGDETARIFSRVEFATRPERGFDPVFEELCRHAGPVLAACHAKGRPCAAISVSIGGPMDVEKGMILSPPNLPGWDAIPLKALLEARFGLPVHIEHDGNAGALAEWKFGAAQGAKNIIFLTMGTGFGGGLILDGRLYRGTSCLAGEVGHIRLAESGPEAFGKTGSWEAFCSGTGLSRLASFRFPARWERSPVSPRELARLAEEGDAAASAVLDEAGRCLGAGLAILLDVLNPEVIVIGSLAVRLGRLVLDPAREVMVREALPGAVAACRLVPAALGERLGDVASLCAAICAMTSPSDPR